MFDFRVNNDLKSGLFITNIALDLKYSGVVINYLQITKT